MTRIKICCIASLAEVEMALEAGVDALGFVSAMPSGPGPIPESDICSIVSRLSPDENTFLLTCETTTQRIVEQQRRCCTNTLQLVDAVPFVELKALREKTTGIDLVQVIHVCDESAIAEAVAVAPLVDAILLDSGNPKLKVKELGGTGRRHDWAISRRIVDAVVRPVWLAGGLNAENVRDAIETVRPYGVDVCSGVRTSGKLDREKLGRFVEAVRKIESTDYTDCTD